MSEASIRVWDADAAPEIEATDVSSPRLTGFLEGLGFEPLGVLVMEQPVSASALAPPARRLHPAWGRLRREVWRSADRRVLALPVRAVGQDSLVLVTLLTDGSEVATAWRDSEAPWDVGRWGASYTLHPSTVPSGRPSCRVGTRPPALLRWVMHHPRSGIWFDTVRCDLGDLPERHEARVLERVRASSMTTVRADLRTAGASLGRRLVLGARRGRPLAAHALVALAGPLGVGAYGVLGWLVAAGTIGVRTGTMPLAPEPVVAGAPWVLSSATLGAVAGVLWVLPCVHRVLLALLPLALGAVLASRMGSPMAFPLVTGLALVPGFFWGAAGATHIVGSQGLGPGLERLNLHQLRLRYGLSDPPAEP